MKLTQPCTKQRPYANLVKSLNAYGPMQGLKFLGHPRFTATGFERGSIENPKNKPFGSEAMNPIRNIKVMHGMELVRCGVMFTRDVRFHRASELQERGDVTSDG